MKRGGISLIIALCISIAAQSFFAQEPPRNLTPDEIQRIMEQERIRRAQELQTNPGIGITRARKADFLYQTKYHAAKLYAGYRVGRHIMMDGEALRVIKITPNEVHLYSDLEFGGNGKLYIKKLIRPGAAIAGGANGGGRAGVAPTTNGASGGP